jgi:uncharacterized membrane protein
MICRAPGPAFSFAHVRNYSLGGTQGFVIPFFEGKQMSEALSSTKARPDPPAVFTRLGRCIFAAAIMALGIETIACARNASHGLGAQYEVIPVLPWLPAIPWVAWLFGAIWILCGVGLLTRSVSRTSAMILGTLLFVCALVLDVPKYALALGNMSLRTGVFEPISIACLAWLLPGPKAIPGWLERLSRYLLAISLVVFGVDHFLALAFIASLIPAWIPFHVFWVAFFGIAFIATGVSIALNLLQRWGAFGLGLMFATYVLTLHTPRVLGLYGIPGAPHNPNEWSSLFIAVALWGGLWALAGGPEK